MREATTKISWGNPTRPMLSDFVSLERHSFSGRMRYHDNRPVHVLFIVENNTVPTDIRVWKEAQTAKKNGYDVSIIAPRSKVFSNTHEVVDGIRIYRHPAFNNGSGKLNQLLEYANAGLWETILSWRVFLKNRFHIIHAANPPDHAFLIARLFRPFGVKFVFDHHDLAPELFLDKFGGHPHLAHRMLTLMERWSCRSAVAVISTNESYRRIVVARHGLQAERVFVVRNDPEVDPGPEPGAPRRDRARREDRRNCCTSDRSTSRTAWISWSGRYTCWCAGSSAPTCIAPWSETATTCGPFGSSAAILR